MEGGYAYQQDPALRTQLYYEGKVDADHDSNTDMNMSKTEFIAYLNCAPIYWIPKKQTSSESYFFGSGFIAMNKCCKYLRGIRYRLSITGTPLVVPSYILGDNLSVLENNSIPESTFEKNIQSIAYHIMKEGADRDEWRAGYVNTYDNEADLLTFSNCLLVRGKSFLRQLLHNIFGVILDVDYMLVD